MKAEIVQNKAVLIDKIEEYLELHKQEIMDSLLELIRVPSVQSEPLKNAPYGKACDDMINATAALMEKHGFKTIKRNDLGYTYSVLDKGSDKTVGAYSHGDVVPVDGEWLMCSPFEPIVKDGFIFGRGCNDDKSGIVQMLYAAKLIRDFKIPFQSNLLLFTGVNEESGMGDIIAFVQNEKLPDAGLVIDGGSYPCDLGERTVYRFDLFHKNPFTMIKSMQGGNAYNIVLPKIEVEISYHEGLFKELQRLTAGENDYAVTAEETTIRLVVNGCASPVTHPERGKNAGLLAMKLLFRCECLCAKDKKIIKDAYDLLADSYGKGFGIAHTDSRFGRLISGNGIIETIEGKLRLSFDIRVGTEMDTETLENKPRSAVEDAWDFRKKELVKGYLVQEDDPFRKGLVEGYKLVAGEDAAIGGDLMAGGTHARHLKNTYPVTNQVKWIIPDYPMPEGHGSYHQPDEKLHIDGFVQAIKVLVFLLLGVDDVLHK